MDHLNQKNLAAILGLSVQQVRNLERHGIPHHPAGREKHYPIPEAVRWYIERKVEEVRKKANSEALLLARTRKTEAEAGLTELDLQRQQGQWIHIDDVERLLRRSLERVNMVVKDLPGRLGPELSKEAGIPLGDAKSLLGDLVERVRAELRDAPGTGEV